MFYYVLKLKYSFFKGNLLSKTKVNPCKEISITELSFLKGWPLNLVSHLNQLAKGNLTKENMLSFAHITYSNYHLTTTEVSVVAS